MKITTNKNAHQLLVFVDRQMVIVTLLGFTTRESPVPNAVSAQTKWFSGA